MQQPWTTAPLVAFDLEGTGSQDGKHEAILEVGIVPLVDGRPDMARSYQSTVNPGRRIARRPWISPGLTNESLAGAPPLDAVAPELVARLDGAFIVGHNVAVDWRLLSRRCPTVRPAALIDTLKLAWVAAASHERSLTALLSAHGLTNEVTALVGHETPHRALWDATGAALLLAALVGRLPGGSAFTVAHLHHVAGLPLNGGADATDDALLLF
ncbi:3'-5' exonuclease [Sphaerisporangium dianthi]|uniref:3'-5' exonuclease n=1 Tax=Sphaerisporangium dianthi TaxID=1436120 RepID=A0ABV9CSR2_9ACTN